MEIEMKLPLANDAAVTLLLKTLAALRVQQVRAAVQKSATVTA